MTAAIKPTTGKRKNGFDKFSGVRFNHPKEWVIRIVRALTSPAGAELE